MTGYYYPVVTEALLELLDGNGAQFMTLTSDTIYNMIFGDWFDIPSQSVSFENAFDYFLPIRGVTCDDDMPAFRLYFSVGRVNEFFVSTNDIETLGDEVNRLFVPYIHSSHSSSSPEEYESKASIRPVIVLNENVTNTEVGKK